MKRPASATLACSAANDPPRERHSQQRRPPATASRSRRAVAAPIAIAPRRPPAVTAISFCRPLARLKQVRHVGARNQQQERNRAEQHHQSLTHRPHHHLASAESHARRDPYWSRGTRARCGSRWRSSRRPRVPDETPSFSRAKTRSERPRDRCARCGGVTSGTQSSAFICQNGGKRNSGGITPITR